MKAVWCFFISFLFLLPVSGLAAKPTPLLDQYQTWMKKFPAAGDPLKSCVVPDLKSNRHVHVYRTVLAGHFKERPPAPDFCGRYFLLSDPVSGGGRLYVSDCETGKVLDGGEEFASFSPLHSLESCLLIEHPPGQDETAENFNESAFGPPRAYFWNGKRLESKKDRIWPKKNK